MRGLALLCIALVACGGSPSGDDDDGVDASVPPALSSDEVATACVLFGSCMGDGINDCYTDAMPFWSNAEARCVLAAGASCTAIRACFGMTVVADPSCTGRMITCDGNNLVNCGDGARSTISCPDASPLLRVGTGATCVPTSTGALCADASCSAAASGCNGSIAESCVTDKGVQLSLDCADYAQSCVNGGCTAAGGGGACAVASPHCDGAAIVRCSGGVELRTDCTVLAVGSSCYGGDRDAPEPYCGFGAACLPTKGAETCSGTSVTFCNAGATATVDCAALGFSSCISGHCF